MDCEVYIPITIILIIFTGAFVSADSSMNNTITHINSSLYVSSDSSYIDNISQADDLVSNETTVIGMKTPKSNLIFMSGLNSTLNITDNFTSPDMVSNESVNQSSDLSVNTSPSKYDSLGDIIKAKDWKALGEYQCRIKTDNKALLDDSNLNTGDQEAKWNGYFNYREPVVISYPCCG
ncbi:hypothetical protein [Methanospirillum lacunae]|uniref:Uncharacterized protein n=1 Tax=Methanospirillum lacunae TaxID=668570 RepID=A0A2V2N1U7_9EURY|nr:hypothetical protein [Methanospirillum lacunae]PWR74072.1 hypothetical protein DK846_02635 [Methanospirillum lacunae]